MDDSMDSRRGAPVMRGNHWSSIDANYEPSGNNCSNSNNSSNGCLVRMEESGLSSSSGSIYVQETGKSPWCSEAPVHKQSQSAAQSSGIQSLQRPNQFSRQGSSPPVLEEFCGDLIESGPESTIATANSDIGLGLNLSDEGGICPGHLQQSTESSALLGMRGHSVSSPDFLSGRLPIQGSSKGEFTTGTREFFPSRLGGGHVTENGVPLMSGLPTTLGSKRQSRASESIIYPAERNGINERKRAADGGRNRAFSYHSTVGHQGVQDVHRNMDGIGIKDAGSSMNSNSHNIEQQDLRRTETQHFRSNSNQIVGLDASSSGANHNQGLVNPEAGCSSEGQLPSDGDHHLLRGSISGRTSENASSSVFGNMRSSSRSSSCKRKSCTPSVSGSLSCGHGSLRNGSRDSNGVRTGRISGMSRRTMGIGGCTSASDVVVSTSSAQAAGRSSGLPGMASGLEEPVARRAKSLQEVLNSRPDTHRGSHLGKSVVASSSAGKSSQRNPRGRGVGLLLAEARASLPSHTSFARTLRTSAPVMQHENSGSQRTVLTDSQRNPNEGNSSSSLLVPNENLAASSTHCHSGSSSGTSSSPRHRDTSLGLSSGGARLSHRYIGSRTHSMATSVSRASQLGAAVAAGSRLRNQELSVNNIESMSLGAPVLAESVPPARQTMSTTLSSTAPSRLPHTPCSRRHGNGVDTQLTNQSMSGSGPSHLCPPLSSPSLMAPFEDTLPSPTSHFQQSLLSRTSPAGVQERGFSSAADSLLGMPFRGLHLSAGNGTHSPHLVAEGLAEIISALEHVERDEDLTYEQLLMLEATLLFGGLRLRDQHSDLRLDVDNMSYEELLALEDRIGNVSTGLSAEAVADKLKRRCYSSFDVVGAQFSQEYDIKCSICQEEYEEGDELGKIECGHSYHVLCIQQWLAQKNQCPICKATAFA